MAASRNTPSHPAPALWGDEIRFMLNNRNIILHDIRPETTLLDYLRLDQRLRGTKEGCAEGDCGACTVLVGRLLEGELIYESVNACIRFLGSLHGCHVVTIEHLKRPNDALHPVQHAMVDHHASQCGFCTPGFVMSLYALWMRHAQPNQEEIEKALQGNLCRCTGYAPIIRAAQAISHYGDAAADPLHQEREAVKTALQTILSEVPRLEISTGHHRLIVPSDSNDLADVLEKEPKAIIVAGSTDAGLWVTKFMRTLSPAVFIGGIADLQTMTEKDNILTIGAGVSYSRAYSRLAETIPSFGQLIDRIGGEQIRNMGTIGGNIANGSPIGDTPPPLIALDALLTLRKGTAHRTIALEDFFIAYGKQDRQSGEFIEALHIPLPQPETQFAVWKISKRHDEDITAALGAFSLRLASDKTVASLRIAYGGMAATPKRARTVEQALIGKPWTADMIEQALPAFESDFSPISDMRASAKYRMMVAKNLLRRFHRVTSAGADDQPASIMLNRYEETF